MKTHFVPIGFKAPADLAERLDAAARAEGISRSAVARRAVMRDLERQAKQETTEKAV
ncbi:MAG: ribbon-helix-helix protein, CopG family [Bradyrhizobiaceae bacterium]|nr:MAG: ribbon-helix-helix protein, CopG family [Bradyrhizobiaceae bacterium]